MGMVPAVILQTVSEAVVTPSPRSPPIEAGRPEEDYPDTDGRPTVEDTWQATTMFTPGKS